MSENGFHDGEGMDEGRESSDGSHLGDMEGVFKEPEEGYADGEDAKADKWIFEGWLGFIYETGGYDGCCVGFYDSGFGILLLCVTAIATSTTSLLLF